MIIFISGSINAGKSTVAKILAQKLERVSVIEVDFFHEFAPWMTIQEASMIKMALTIKAIREFIAQQCNVIIPYPLSQKNHDHLMRELRDVGEQIFVFTLSPQMDVALVNRGSRELSSWEKERIAYHYQSGIATPKFGMIIDNSMQKPEETANMITDHIMHENKSTKGN